MITNMTGSHSNNISADILEIIEHFQFEQLTVEGTLYKSTYRSSHEFEDGSPMGAAIIGMYCEEQLSVSYFHRLQHDQIWHFYGGDTLVLYLL